jgi:hypothetical protein
VIDAEERLPDDVAVVVHLEPASSRDAIAPGPSVALAAYEVRRLCFEAHERGAIRLVLLSTLDLFTAYPDDYLIDEWWKPIPGADPRLLACSLAEETARQCSLDLEIPVLVIRADSELPTQDVADLLLRAVEKPVSFRRYRCVVIHASRARRFHAHRARELLGWEGARGRG